MSLASVLKPPPVVWLAPKSGVQFIDLGFRLAGARNLISNWSFSDDAAMDAPRIVARGDKEAAGRVAYEIDWKRVLETFNGVWVPLPFFRRA